MKWLRTRKQIGMGYIETSPAGQTAVEVYAVEYHNPVPGTCDLRQHGTNAASAHGIPAIGSPYPGDSAMIVSDRRARPVGDGGSTEERLIVDVTYTPAPVAS